MKFIGQYIQSFIARFRSDVYLEDIDTGTIASGGNLGLDSNNKIVKATETTGDLTRIDLGSGLSGTSLTGPIPEIGLDVSQPTITTLAGLTSLGAAGATTTIAAGDVTMYNAVNDGNPTISLGSSATNRFEIKTEYNSGAQTLDEVYFNSYTTSSSTNDGRYIFQVDEVELIRFLDSGVSCQGFVSAKTGLTDTNVTASSATEGGKLQLQADDGAAMADNHRLGVIEFLGAEDASATRSIGARIQAICRDTWDGSNNDADLEFYTTDGTTESKVLTLDADKLATFAGAVTVTGALSGTLATVSQPNITGVGTIGTGVWQGTAIATDQQKHLANFEFEGFSVGDGTNYMIAEINSDTKAPFEHQTSTGSDGLTATAPVRLLKTAGHVMPYAGTLKLWKGWATSSGGARQTVDVGLYKVTLVNNDDDDISPVALKNTSFTCLGNTIPLIFSEDSFSVAFAAGDILISAIRNGTSGKRCDFSSTLVVEWN